MLLAPQSPRLPLRCLLSAEQAAHPGVLEAQGPMRAASSQRTALAESSRVPYRVAMPFVGLGPNVAPKGPTSKCQHRGGQVSPYEWGEEARSVSDPSSRRQRCCPLQSLPTRRQALGPSTS